MYGPVKYFSFLTLIFILLLLIHACSDDEEMSSDLYADAGNDVNVLVGQPVSLNGNGSFDLQGNEFEFMWEFLSRPAGSTAVIQDQTSATPSFSPDVQGKYRIELTISNTSESMDTVLVAAFSVENIEGEFENIFPGPNVGIRDFVTACGELFATCEFTEIGGIEAKKIARYNGSGWNPVGCGLEEGSIYDMIVFRDELYVTGDFVEIGCIEANNIAKWDCNGWKALDGGLTGGDDPFGNALEVYNDELYVGGRFTMAGDVQVVNIAKWDGMEWSAVGSLENGSVRELVVYNQELYAGGFFDMADGVEANYIAVYNGSGWSSPGPMDNLQLGSTGVVKHMVVYDNLLFISGDFTSGGNDLSELIFWDGSRFDDFGRAFSRFQDNVIYELSVVNNILYIGGEFTNVVGTRANNILQWDGENWGILSEGISGTVLSIESFNGNTWIGGDFLEAGGQTAENISIWNEN